MTMFSFVKHLELTRILSREKIAFLRISPSAIPFAGEFRLLLKVKTEKRVEYDAIIAVIPENLTVSESFNLLHDDYFLLVN